jgi:hypothetical protein
METKASKKQCPGAVGIGLIILKIDAGGGYNPNTAAAFSRNKLPSRI